MEMLTLLAQLTFMIDLFILKTEQELIQKVSNSNIQTGNQMNHTINLTLLQQLRKVQMFLGNNQLKKLGIMKLEPYLIPSTENGTTQMVLKELKMIKLSLIRTNKKLQKCQKITTKTLLQPTDQVPICK
jgi:hypothetical protein